MDRNSSNKRVFLTDHEVAKRAAPGGKLPVATAKSNPYGDSAYTSLADGTPAAAAARAEREDTRDKPALAAK
jgi:hypothetical protein